MDRSYIAENQRERERLTNLVSRITDQQLSLQIYSEGWTVAVALAHVAFWDQRRLWLLRKSKQTGKAVKPASDDNLGNMINDSLLPFFLALPPRKAANLAVEIATELDRELESISQALQKEIEDLGDRFALNRGVHRKTHLDEIEKLLQEQG